MICPFCEQEYEGEHNCESDDGLHLDSGSDDEEGGNGGIDASGEEEEDVLEVDSLSDDEDWTGPVYPPSPQQQNRRRGGLMRRAAAAAQRVQAAVARAGSAASSVASRAISSASSAVRRVPSPPASAGHHRAQQRRAQEENENHRDRNSLRQRLERLQQQARQSNLLAWRLPRREQPQDDDAPNVPPAVDSEEEDDDDTDDIAAAADDVEDAVDEEDANVAPAAEDVPPLVQELPSNVMLGLRQETISGRPSNFDHGEGTGGLWQRFQHCHPSQLPPGLLWTSGNVSNNVLSPYYDQPELQQHLVELRQRSDSFFPGPSSPLRLFQVDSHARDPGDIEILFNNHFEPRHERPNARLLETKTINGSLRLRERCPEFQLQTVAKVASAMYNMHPITAYTCAVRTIAFGNIIPYSLPFDICHSGADNLAIYERIASFGIPIQKQITQAITRECQNLHSGISFGERPFSTVDSSWGVNFLNTLPLDHPMRMHLRWLFPDGRVRIIRYISMFLSRAMGVPYVDPVDLTTGLDDILWCRTQLTNRTGLASLETRQRILDTIEDLLPYLSNSVQASFWEEGIPDSFVDYILNLSVDECRAMSNRIRNALSHPEWVFAAGLWRCTGCDRAAMTTYGTECGHGDCTGRYTNTYDGTPFILVGFCAEADCHNWGLWGHKCLRRRGNDNGFRCWDNTGSYLRLFIPPVGHDATVVPHRPLIRKLSDGVLDGGFSRYDLATEDVFGVCTEIRGRQTNALLPAFICVRNNPRGRLRATGGANVGVSQFGLALRDNVWKGEDGVLVIGDITWLVVDRYENVDHFS